MPEISLVDALATEIIRTLPVEWINEVISSLSKRTTHIDIMIPTKRQSQHMSNKLSQEHFMAALKEHVSSFDIWK